MHKSIFFQTLDNKNLRVRVESITYQLLQQTQIWPNIYLRDAFWKVSKCRIFKMFSKILKNEHGRANVKVESVDTMKLDQAVIGL